MKYSNIATLLAVFSALMGAVVSIAAIRQRKAGK